MQVLLNIPEDLARHMEFIPESMLSKVIIDAIWDKILYKHKEDKQNPDMACILEKLEGMLSQGFVMPIAEHKGSVSTAEPQATAENIVQFESPEVNKEIKVSKVKAFDDNDEDGLDDFMDLMR